MISVLIQQALLIIVYQILYKMICKHSTEVTDTHTPL